MMKRNNPVNLLRAWFPMVMPGVMAGVLVQRAWAQDLPPVVVPPVVVEPMPVPAGGGAEAAPVEEKGEDFAREVAKMKFERTPESLLEAVRGQADGKEPGKAERFRTAVLLGDWGSVAEVLKQVPVADAWAAYNPLLVALAAGSQSATQYYQQESPGRQAQMMQAQGEGAVKNPAADKRSVFLSDDLYAVLEAAPGDLGADHVGSVGALVKIAIGAGGREGFLARLRAGLRGFGGESPTGRVLAARLLSEVGWIEDAGPYLPLERGAWEQAETLPLVLAMEYFTRLGVRDRDERQTARAAELCAFMMQTSRFEKDDGGLFRQATDRFIKLLPALGEAEAERLVRVNFLTQPGILTDLMLALGEAGQAARRGGDLETRGQALATQQAVLKVLAGRKGAPPEAVNVLVSNWLSEAEATYRSGMLSTPELDPSRDPYLYQNLYYGRRNPNAEKVVKQELLLANAPPEGLVRRLNRGLAQRVGLTLVKLNLMDPRGEVTLDLLKAFVAAHPGQERELCQEYLTAWTRRRAVAAEDPNIVRMRALGYVISRGQDDGSGGIPLTRARQDRNVAEFKEMLAGLRVLSSGGLDPAAVVQSFMAIHSGAEVYRAGDIEAIFGPPEKMDRAELMQLVSGMRAKLKEQWQDPKVQQDASTNRTEEEVKDEVSRGYQTALDLLRRGLGEEDDDWRAFIVRGQLFFDAAEFAFSRQVKLGEYVGLRDEAFESYRRAAKAYAGKVGEMPRGQWTLEPYQAWFIVMLGASDLTHLGKSAARSDPGLREIGEAMEGLPGDAGAEHARRFGAMLTALLPQVPGNMRQQFLLAGLKVFPAGHEAGQKARELLAGYEELLDEVRLRVVLDGGMEVGHTQPFGFSIAIEHTRQLARESGGFSRYLQNAPAQRMGMAPQQQAVNHRDEFTKNIHAALDEMFEVVSITYHDPAAPALDVEGGWLQETPVAYVVVRARDAAVDRIPALQMDMDFSDTSGRVVLPVRSQVVPVNAQGEDGERVRPCPGLSLVATMDEREWAGDGRVVVEITAKANGVIPPHGLLFEHAQRGFDVEVTDTGLAVVEYVTEGRGRKVNAERSWQFTYQRAKDLRGDVRLAFPRVKDGVEVASVAYQHYRDADLEQVDPALAAQGVLLKGVVGNRLRDGLIVVGLAGAFAGLLMWLARRFRRSTVAIESLGLPERLTPFSVVAFLRRIERECGAVLDAAGRAALGEEIARIEAGHFRRGAGEVPVAELEATARKWLQAVSTIK